jgi:hypothetical protein
MRIMVKTVVFLIVLMIFGVVYPQDKNETNGNINYAVKLEVPPKNLR